MCGLAIVNPIGPVTAREESFASRADLIRILRAESFEIVSDVKKIPDTDLRSAGVIAQSQRLTAALVNPGQPFNSSDAWADSSKLGQLIVAAVNKQHEILCFWRATHGGPAAYFMLVRRAARQSAVVFYASLDGDPHTWQDVKTLLFDGKISEFISAAYPQPYKR